MPRTFHDDRGREWIVAITLGTVKRLQDAGGPDLFALGEGDPPLIQRLFRRPLEQFDLLWRVILPQAHAAIPPVESEEWMDSLSGKAGCEAALALWSEINDFFRQFGREELADAVEAQTQIVAAAIAEQASRTRAVLPLAIGNIAEAGAKAEAEVRQRLAASTGT